MTRALGKGNFISKARQDQRNTQWKRCYFCGKRFTPEHKAKCQARGAICRSCGNKVANVEQPEPDEEECNFIDSENDENYSILKIFESSIETETVK